MAYPLEYAALRIQTLWRCHWQIRQYKEIMAAHQRRLLVEEQMRQVELENQRQRLIYQKQIEAYYQRIRKEAKQKIIDDQRVLEVIKDGRSRIMTLHTNPKWLWSREGAGRIVPLFVCLFVCIPIC